MAKAEEAPGSAKGSGGSSGVLGFLLALVVATAVGGGGGGLFGMYVVSAVGGGAGKGAKKASEAAPSAQAADTSLKPLNPIVTNLGGPKGTWIRLEAALLLEGVPAKDDSLLSAQITEDIIAFLRTVPLAHIEGADGFQNLRADLNDRARIRSGGRARELVIQSMILE